MPLVQRLSETLINQIAAGEVVERPASVAKELCENALDAGARQISIEIVDGGLRRLVISDDGCGMSPEDARACLERHATSKLRAEEGLKNIGTLGFRGEALPAIASVSRFVLTTRPNSAAHRVLTSWETPNRALSDGSAPEQLPESDMGTRITAEGGEILCAEAVGAPKGTRIEVADLFFNTPARRKFLKRPATEASHLIEAVSRLAIARPEVGFRLVSNGREVFASPPGRDPKDRLSVALGREAVRHLLPVDTERGNVRVRGFITDPDHTLSTSKGIYTYVNGRFVRDRSLVAVIQRSYRDVTEPGRNPACVLFIDLPLSEVDINVHPQKLEVRFADAQAVTGTVFRAVQEALRDSPWLRQKLGDGGKTAAPEAASWDAASDAGVNACALREGECALYAPVSSSPAIPLRPESIWGTAAPSRSQIPRHSYEDVPLPFRPRPGTVVEEIPAPSGALTAGPECESGSTQAADVPSLPAPDVSAVRPELSAPAPASSQGYFHSLRIIGQFAATYIVCEAPGPKLVVIDQHAAHERVRFHALREAFRSGKPVVQPFLIPLTVELAPAMAAVLADNSEALARIGFEVEPFGGGSLALKAVPALMVGSDHQKLLEDMAGELLQVGRTKAFDEAMDHALATMACHSAIRAHELHTEAELRALLDSLDEIDFSTRCPHGRPIAASIPLSELEKEVARR